MINENLQWMKTPFAHRGLFDNVNVPENSILAFEKAVERGFGMEFDVQMTKDQVLVVFHDDNMKRMTGLDKDIRETTWEEIKHLTLLDTDQKIPTLAEVLKVCKSQPLVVEIKTHKNVGVAEQLIYQQIKDYPGKLCIESFNPFIVRWYFKNAPEIIRGQLSCDHRESPLPAWQKFALKNLIFCKWNKSQFIAYDVNSFQQCKALEKYRKKMPIIFWTIKTQQQLENNFDFCDGYIFDSFVPQ
ncbi:MAG: glycerophosphodiester phosphodiesterase [Clostridia bacterium]|nr:glycerophosphodiester phosphodiesterase [Clostridia bacterium]